MAVTIVFRARDGKVFEDQCSATAHDHLCGQMEMLEHHMRKDLPSSNLDLDEIIAWIKDNRELVKRQVDDPDDIPY